MLRATPQLLSFRATPPVSFTTDAVAKPSLSRPGHKPHAQRRPSLDPMGVPRLHMAVAPGIRSGTALAGLDLGLYIRRNSAVSTGCSPVFAAFQHVCLLDRATYIRRAASSLGLLATSFGGLHHLTGLSTHPLTALFLPLCTFLFCIRDFHVRCSRVHPPSWELTASACIIQLCSLFARPPTLFLPYLILANSSLFSHICTQTCYLF
jgi:hypothetical protein